MRALDRLEDLLARHRFELGAIGLDDVDGVAAGAGFLDRAVEDGFGSGAPQAGLDAVFLLERLDDRPEVGRLRGGINRQLAFALGAVDQPLQAIGALVRRQLRGRRRLCRCGGADRMPRCQQASAR